LELQVRVGVNTGEAVVALGARPEQGEGIVTGDVVNTAARIESAAPPGGVAVGEQTYRATSRVFEYERLQPVSAKGKSEPLPLWQAKAARARFGTDISREYTTPLVGRDLEKPLLIGTFERAATQRSVHLVTLVGEPGVGKTRLVAELFTYLGSKPELTRWRQGRCLPYGEGITFWALGEIVKAEAGILESDSAEVATAKLDAAISPEERERQWLLQRLSPLVGVEAASPAERQELFTAWRRYLEALAAARQTVLVFEDIHWADEPLLAFLEHLAEWAEGVPLLVLCTARPELYERHPGWAGGIRNATTINLPPLSDEETAKLVSHLIASTVVSEGLKHAVLERAGGNPLYAEEFVRLLADHGLEHMGGTLAGSEVPESLQALIAARLDTLPPDRKSLLQDAAVLGKVFWVGALAEIGGRDQADVELALHELARKELVRPARVSSMEQESEYSFWHVLVRDVAYGQIPRPERARRHRSAAAWIERKGGGRVEDQAELLAHHYLQALELAEVVGDTEQAGALAAPARRFLALAGERALGLDTVQAEARLARALELCRADDPERPELLLRWADAANQSGRTREAAAALEEALAAFRATGEKEGEARALMLLAQATYILAEGRRTVLAAEAVALLELDPPGPTLVAAYTELAVAQFLAGSYGEAIAAADRACALAETLGVPEPARAVSRRGFSRAMLGDSDGLTEMERALPLLLEQGGGDEAAATQNNIAIARYPLEGPARSLAAFEQAIAFCEQRGLADMAAQLECDCPGLLVELARPEEALERAGRLAAIFEASGANYRLVWVRAVEVAIHLDRGDAAVAPRLVDWLVETAHGSFAADVTVEVLGPAAAARLALGAPDQASTLLTEIEGTQGARDLPYYSRQLAAMQRTALAAGDPELARRLAHGLEPRYPVREHALCAAHAQLAEHDGDHADAAVLYAEAAARWQQFGVVPEQAHALLGHGRCLVALADPGAEQRLRQAAELFRSMGYKPALRESEALLEQTTAAAS
jgi:tetratricopeptide (TPR) repeat protein